MVARNPQGLGYLRLLSLPSFVAVLATCMAFLAVETRNGCVRKRSKRVISVNISLLFPRYCFFANIVEDMFLTIVR